MSNLAHRFYKLLLMKIKILFFGIARDITEKSFMVLELNVDATIQQLVSELKKIYPKFSSINEYSIALNEEYVEMNAILTVNDVVAIIPPVSGG